MENPYGNWRVTKTKHDEDMYTNEFNGLCVWEVPDCSICCEREAKVILHCGHYFCSQCLAIENRQRRSLRGQHRCFSCSRILTEEELRLFLSSEEIIESFEALAMKWLDHCRDNKTMCLKCGKMSLCDGSNNSFECPHCQTKSCTKCSTMWTIEHSNLECEKSQQRRKKMQMQAEKQKMKQSKKTKKRSLKEEHRSSEWMQVNTKKCPHCQTPIEKNGGCLHMRCSICSHEFCWNCLQEYSTLPNMLRIHSCPAQTQKTTNTRRKFSWLRFWKWARN